MNVFDTHAKIVANYTISPAARKELLRRPLVLNHTQAAAESGAAPPSGDDHVDMFPEES
jgi:hypothetical protein